MKARIPDAIEVQLNGEQEFYLNNKYIENGLWMLNG